MNKWKWGLLALGAALVALRWLPNPMNFVPIGAFALFCGARLARHPHEAATDKRWSKLLAPLALLLAPLVVMGIADLGLEFAYSMGWRDYPGLYSGMWVTYGCYLFIGAGGLAFRKSGPWLTGLLGGSLASVIFFLVTNGAVWATGGSGLHAADPGLSGLWVCYVDAIPFFRNTLASDILFGLVLCHAYAYAQKSIATSAAQTAAT